MSTSDDRHPAADCRPTDRELVRRMAEDDLDAFAELFERHRVAIFRAALGLTGDYGTAEEILMDTFRRAYQHRARLRPDVSPLPWLHKVALNLAYSRLGRRRLPSERVTDEVAASLADRGLGPDDHAQGRELGRIVREGIRGLAPKHRAVVISYYLEGRSLQETADLLALPLGTVKSRLHHALRALRWRLEADRRFGGAWGAVVAEEREGGEA